MFSSWRIAPAYRPGASQNKLKGPKDGRLEAGRSFVVITTVPPGAEEKDRMVMGMFLVDTVSSVNEEVLLGKDGFIDSDVRNSVVPLGDEPSPMVTFLKARRNRLRLRCSENTAQNVLWWNHGEPDVSPLERYWDDDEIYVSTGTLLSILNTAYGASEDPEEAGLIRDARDFLWGNVSLEYVSEPVPADGARSELDDDWNDEWDAAAARFLEEMETLRRNLGEYVARSPELIGLDSSKIKRALVDEYRFDTLTEAPNVILELTDGTTVLVVTEPYFSTRAVYQIITYWVLFNAHEGRELLDRAVKPVIVFCEDAPEEEVQEAIELCERYGVAWFKLPSPLCMKLRDKK